jgi:hypothetical protein
MAEAIIAASMQSSERLNQMGSAGREYALQNLTQQSNLPRVVEILEKAARLQRGNTESAASITQ